MKEAYDNRTKRDLQNSKESVAPDPSAIAHMNWNTKYKDLFENSGYRISDDGVIVGPANKKLKTNKLGEYWFRFKDGRPKIKMTLDQIKKFRDDLFV